jgi:hypothetical protein
MFGHAAPAGQRPRIDFLRPDDARGIDAAAGCFARALALHEPLTAALRRGDPSTSGALEVAAHDLVAAAADGGLVAVLDDGEGGVLAALVARPLPVTPFELPLPLAPLARVWNRLGVYFERLLGTRPDRPPVAQLLPVASADVPGRGLDGLMVAAVLAQARRLGFVEAVAPATGPAQDVLGRAGFETLFSFSCRAIDVPLRAKLMWRSL